MISRHTGPLRWMISEAACALWLLPLILLSGLMPSAGAAYTTSAEIQVTRVVDPVLAGIDQPVTVTLTISNTGENPIRGFYFSEFLPSELEILSHGVTIGGSTVENYVYETDAVGTVYEGHRAHRWVLEIPPSFTQSNPVGPGAVLQIQYTVASSALGEFILKSNWVGFLENISPPDQASAFGYFNDEMEEVVSFRVVQSLLAGDVNGDEEVTLADAILVQHILADLAPSSINLAADVDGNEKIDTAELIYILQDLAGLRTSP